MLFSLTVKKTIEHNLSPNMFVWSIFNWFYFWTNWFKLKTLLTVCFQRETWPQHPDNHVIKSSDLVIISLVWRQNDLHKNFRWRFKELLHSLGNPCLMKLSDAWIPLKYLHHYSYIVWKLEMLYCCSCTKKLCCTFVSICCKKILSKCLNKVLTVI